jgi:nucleoside-diphosphate-sugar epimerase
VATKYNILVTGAAGFVGRHICAELVRKGHGVLGVSRRPFVLSQVRSVVTDLAVPGQLGDMCRDQSIDVIVHAAAAIPGSSGDPSTNHQLTTEVLRFAQTRKVIRFVFASSCSVYGQCDGTPRNEQDVVKPEHPYAVSKLREEQMVLAAADHFSSGSCALRISAPYGANGPVPTVVNLFLTQAAKGGPVSVHGTGDREQHFVHVSDVGRAFCGAVCGTEVGVFNVSGPKAVSMSSLGVACAGLFGHSHVTYQEGVEHQEPYRANFPSKAAADAFGYTPQVELLSGLRQTAVEMNLLVG